jgi:hypothetical protein
VIGEYYEDPDNYDKYEVKLPAPISISGLRNRNLATHNHGHKVVDDTVVEPAFVASFAEFNQRSEQYDFRTALFGDPARGISSAATSSNYTGWRYKETKKQLVNFSNKTYNPKLEEDTLAYLAAARKGPIAPAAQQFPKAELLDPAKVHANMPRIIYGHDLAYNLALRMVFGGLVEDFVRYHSKTKTGMGVNPNSIDWATVYTKSHAHPNIMCTDVNKQEASVGLVFSRAFAVFCKSKINVPPGDEVLIDNLCEGLSSYYFIHDGVVYLSVLGHSSGHYLTTLFNSFTVWCGLKLAFRALVPDKVFEEHVSPCTTGDDGVTGVSDAVKDKYNTTTCSHYFMDRWGIVLTDATKSKTPAPFVVIDSAAHSFLGRTFTKEKRSGKIVGRLRMSSIDNMLIWTKKVNGVKPDDMIKMRAEMAFSELANYESSIYEDKRRQYYQDCKLNHIECPPIPNWQDMRKLVHNNWNRSDNAVEYKPYPTAALSW